MAAAAAAKPPLMEKTLESAEEEFYVHANSPLATLVLHEPQFRELMPWLYDSFGKLIDKVLACDAWRYRFELCSRDDIRAAVDWLCALPLSCFSFGTTSSSSDDELIRVEDPFEVVWPATAGWVRVKTRHLLLAMRLVHSFKNYMSDREQPGMVGIAMQQSPFNDELLDKPLNIVWELAIQQQQQQPQQQQPDDRRPVPLCYFSSNSSSVEDERGRAMGPLTIRRLIGMLTGMAYVSPAAVRLDAKSIYVADAARSAYFVTHRHELARRHPTPNQWRVVVRGSVRRFAVRLSLTDLMQDLYKCYEETMIVNRVAGVL